MSVSRVLDRTGRAVTSERPALCQAPTANPAVRNTSDMTQMAQPVCRNELGPEMQAFAEVEKQPEHRGEQHHEAAQRRGDARDVKGAHRLPAVRGDYRITRGHCPANTSRGGALPDRTGANLSIR